MSDFFDYFDGLMLGDGSLNKPEGGITYRYTQGCMTSYKEWLELIKERFELDGIQSKIRLHKKPGRYFNKSFNGFIDSNGSHILESRVYDFLTEQEKRWYVKEYNVDEYHTHYWHKDKDGEWYIRRKVVPKDIKLTPECIANWHMGDGYANRVNGQIELATNSFTKEEVEFLSFLLEDQVVEETHVGSRNTIFIGKISSARSFLDYVRPHIKQVSCFHYKIPEINW